jgi:O-antigen/teichoic acid export membrane protein
MSLKQKTVSGFIWTAAGMLGNGVVSFLVTMILARILLPYDFALVALLSIFLTISNVIVDSGFSQAIIRDDNPTETDLSSVFYFNIVLSFILYLVLFFAAPAISNYFAAPELVVLSRVVFLVIIFNSFTIIQNATLNRDLNFPLVNKASVIGTFLAGIISVIMAFTGFGVWALVANMILLPFFRAVFLWLYSNWRPKRTFSILSVKRYFAFGGFLMVQGIIDAISTNLVSLIIGRVYTKNDLGYFSQGRRLDGYIVAPFNSIVQKVRKRCSERSRREGKITKNEK